ncbi:MAG: PhzF family phenazine biosynthesis protein, partial [Alphaproteobacteria bacterium]
YGGETIGFETLSGRLTVRRDGDALVMDFPANPPEALPATPAALAKALGGKVEATLKASGGAGYLMAVYAKAADVAALAPDFAALARLDAGAVIVTAPGDANGGGYDFVSRMFAPAKGIDEDPVTGSAHCALAPYWAGRLGKRALQARQISRRGGDVACRVEGDRVHLSGTAALYMTGRIAI